MKVCRNAVLAHYDPHGLVAPHVRHTVEAIAGFVDRLVVVSTADLLDADRTWLEERCTLVTRTNTGYDFASYREGIARLDLSTVDELVIVNDSTVFPLVPLEDIFRKVDGGAHFWGITEGFGFGPHVQTYFVVFRGPALRADVFERFWQGVEFLERDDVITGYEVGLSRALTSAGFKSDTYYRPNVVDLIQGAARAHGDEGRAYWRDRRMLKVAGWVRRTSYSARRPEWNVCAALADRALGRRPRLPMVKISVLRDDPYHVDTERLLAACERRHPEAFAGVREYLRRTS